MDRRQPQPWNASNESLNLHSTGAGIRKSNSRSRRRASPHWSEEAVRGSCTPAMPIPTNATTLTQESFNAWMEAQQVLDTAPMNNLPRTPEEEAEATVNELLGILPDVQDDSTTGLASTSRPPWSSYPVSTSISPITAPEYTYSPAPTAFSGMPAFMPPAQTDYSPLLFPSTTAPNAPGFQSSVGGGNDFTFSTSNHHTFPQDLLGVGSFLAQTPNAPETAQRPRYDMVPELAISEVSQADRTPFRRPLQYKPLCTWYHLLIT